MNLPEEFRKHTKIQNLFSTGDRIVIGFSGGPDSTALTHLLADLQNKMGFYLHAAHLNHGLRAAAKKDEEFVKTTAAQLGIPCTTKFIPVKALKNKTSLEEVAREQRLQFLFQTAEKHHCPKIALAHTQDDQAETVLMNLLRGSGLMGLRGILPLNYMEGKTLVRPLLEFRKSEILAYLKNKRFGFRVDASNRSHDFFRNRIRLAAIPELNRLSEKDVVPSLARLAQAIAPDYDYLETAGREALNKYRLSADNRRISLEIKGLRSLHPSMRRMVIRLALIQLQGSARRISLEHVNDIDRLLLSSDRTGTCVLPKTLQVRKSAKALQFELFKA